MCEPTLRPAGWLVLVVGPSGAGKDSLLRAARAALADDPRFAFPQRWVTRPPDASEDSREITAAAFADSRSRGHFALAWEAHGHGYAIGREIEHLLARGNTVVCNVSRTVVGEARDRFPNTLVIEISARPDVLADRLRGRRREDPEAQARRLERTVGTDSGYKADTAIDNSGVLEAAVASMLEALRATRRAEA